MFLICSIAIWYKCVFRIPVDFRQEDAWIMTQLIFVLISTTRGRAVGCANGSVFCVITLMLSKLCVQERCRCPPGALPEMSPAGSGLSQIREATARRESLRLRSMGECLDRIQQLPVLCSTTYPRSGNCGIVSRSVNAMPSKCRIRDAAKRGRLSRSPLSGELPMYPAAFSR
jgi:hypothetical protein